MLITAIGDSGIAVNTVSYRGNLLVSPAEVAPWNVARFEELAERDFAALTEKTPEVVLLGTGNRQRFPHPRLTRALSAARIGLEVMDLRAACRTYNVLLAEDRRVLAALLFDPGAASAT